MALEMHVEVEHLLKYKKNFSIKNFSWFSKKCKKIVCMSTFFSKLKYEKKNFV